MKRLLQLKMRTLQICAVFLIMQNAYAQRISSTFDVDADGWTVINNDGSWNFGRGNGPEYFTTGGNPDGHIQVVDNIPGAYTAVAPSKFHGDWSAYNNGIISFDARAVSGLALPERVEFGLLTISSPYGVAQLDIAPTAPTSVFTVYSVNLTDSIWGKTASEWQLILSNVSSVTIIIEYSIAGIGDDRVAFDNFVVGQPNIVLPPCHSDNVYLCHRASGNKEKEHTICVDENAVSAHLRHGDYLGPCTSNKNAGVETAIEEASSFASEEEGISLFPNPFNNSLTINMGNINESDYGKIEIKLYDFIGRNVMDIKGIENSKQEMDMSILRDGIYTYCILRDNAYLQSGKLKKGM